MIPFCSCSTLLPGAGTRGAHRQQTKTGRGFGPSWGLPPSEDLSEPPSLRDPALCEAVTGRKYHCRLSGSWQMARHRPPWDGYFPLCTFDAIFLTGTFLPCRWFWRVLRAALLLKAGQLTYLCCWIWPPDGGIFKVQKEGKIPSIYLHLGRAFCTP